MIRKENFIYVGIDLHKETHTAVILNCWNEKLGEITFENKTSDFPKLTRKVNRYCTEDLIPIYGLENAYGYGRALAVWLLEHGCIVKDVNTALSYAQRKSTPMYQKRQLCAKVMKVQRITMVEMNGILYLILKQVSGH